MFMRFFTELRQAKVPVTLKEYLALMEGLDKQVIDRSVDDFYYLSRAALVKDEKNLDRFDQVFSHVFKGLGGFEALMEALAKRAKEQAEEESDEKEGKGRGQGGNNSPFGANGYHPEGIRIGQDKGRHGKAIKVWDKGEYKNLDDQVELGTRNIKVALRRLRKWVREGSPDELDMGGTI